MKGRARCGDEGRTLITNAGEGARVVAREVVVGPRAR